MKTCPVCSSLLSENAEFCYVCTAEHNPAPAKPESDYNAIFLKVLCVLTIIGSAIGMISPPFALAVASEYGVEGVSGITMGISMALSLVKLIAAIMMLKKKLTGLYVYSVAAVLGLAQAIYQITMAKGDNMNGLFSGVLEIGVILVFLIMYLLPVNRKQLS